MERDKLSIAEVKKIDMVEYLEKLGHSPNKIRNNDYWYLSPLRDEKTPSFKVDRKLNVWYDHGLQKGGNLVDFGILFYQCTVKELLQKIEQKNHFPFHTQSPLFKSISFSAAGEKEKIVVRDVRSNIKLLSLKQYLSFRKIPLEIANRFCKEIDFDLYDKKYTVIGFQNSAGGYELRSANFKGSSSPKEVTLIGKNLSNEILVFEGFIDFLSYQTMHQRKFIMMTKQQPNFLVLNSIGFMEKMKPQLEKYPSIHLYLDRDNKGLTITKEVLAISRKYRDESLIYKNHKDLNEFLMKEHFEQRQSQRRGRRL
ncbi:DNA primase [Sediminibacterium roseum]|uniref:DNA primase n=1 Tax=Sediminibacterium roseum TaxID=1978412 RepID=A0ABW9ZSR5_9BACT|nr:toprim domain-containing protein [Sediminibacterium roseum]NCI49324.1 DNA primase [Sediminibacterium roseum]TAJ60637.1 MAG: DNA primase [Chitinophagaceae bacterium]